MKGARDLGSIRAIETPERRHLNLVTFVNRDFFLMVKKKSFTVEDERRKNSTFEIFRDIFRAQ